MRKWSLAVIVGVLILGAAAAAEEVTVEFWHWHYPNLEQVIAEFNAEYAGDIKIEAQLVDFGEYYTKLQVAILGGIGPDIGIMHTPVVPNWAQRGLLRPIDEDLAAIGVGPESFRPSYVWESTVYRSRQYGLPYGVHPMLLYYNRSLLAEAGLVGPPANAAEFISHAQKLTRTDPDGRTQVWGTRIWPWWFHAASAIVQHGGSLFTEDGMRAAISSGVAADALQYLADLVFAHEVSPRPDQPVPDFIAGTLALSIDGVWMLPAFKRHRQQDPLFEFGVASADNLYGNEDRAVWGNGHSLVMLSGVEEARREAVITVMDYLSRESARWIDDIPVRDVAATSEEFLAQPEYAVILQQQIKFLPPYPWAEAIPGPLEQAMARVFHERISPQVALEQAANAVNVTIREFIEEMEQE